MTSWNEENQSRDATTTTVVADDDVDVDDDSYRHAMQETTSCNSLHDLQVSFSHVQMYVDSMEPLSVYKQLEDVLNLFHDQDTSQWDVEKKTLLWKSLIDPVPSKGDSSNTIEYVSSPSSRLVEAHVSPNRSRDLIQQLLIGFGFRITGCHGMEDHQQQQQQGGGDRVLTTKSTTHSLLITSKDPLGVQIVITAASSLPQPDNKQGEEKEAVMYNNSEYTHFDVESLHRFFDSHSNRQGIAVLGFQTNNVDHIRRRYQLLHPNLIQSYRKYGTTKILQVYAFYTNHDDDNRNQEDETVPHREADQGTILRFVEVSSGTGSAGGCILPGIQTVDAIFDEMSDAAYCDHWVSNVYSRTEFLTILEDTLGFTPQVDFNAGVVAAGEAQIESTVTGNTPPPHSVSVMDPSEALKNQNQVYLPINNALSPVGHVYGFLEEIGQGIQHIASRVNSLVDFVERCNRMYDITGEGFTFLKIPRSYYGILTVEYLQGQTDISYDLALKIIHICERHHIVVSIDGAVDLDVTREGLMEILDSETWSDDTDKEIYDDKKESIADAVLSSRYCNLYGLLRNQISEMTYMRIVRNQILVDVQGEDILYQIFTCKILNRNVTDEAPFLEIIQRVCSQCEDEDGCKNRKIKSGCGGFGIRNFLTLFLSIELTKALREVAEERQKGDKKRIVLAERRVDCFTNQLNDSNPILTEISDAMTEEGNCRDQIDAATLIGDVETCKLWEERLETANKKKQEGNAKLMACSARYQAIMRSIREMDEERLS